MMKIYPGWFVFFLFNVFGVSLVLCGDNWFVVWLGFELTLIGFLPMFAGGSLMVEGMIKYFLVQAGGSGVFALSFFVPFSFFSFGLLLLGMFIKLGVFPFYSWVPLVMRRMTWCGCLLLATIQKLGPFFVLLGQVSSGSYFLILFAVLTILVGGLLGYNQAYMRSLMAYSSVSHTGWLILSLVYSFGLFFLYLFVYYFLVVFLFGLFSFLKTHKVVVSSCGTGLWFFANLFMLSLSGVPPFSVFYLKVGVIYYLVSSFYFVPLVLFGSMLSIYYYLTFVIPSLSLFWLDRDFGISGFPFLFSVVVSLSFPFLFFF